MWIGIDFGTCYSSAAYVKDGRPILVTFPPKRDTSLPSSVYVDGGDKLLVGDAAEFKFRANPTRYQREFKRDLGSKTPYRRGGESWLPEQFVVAVLKRIKTEADTQITDNSLSAVITVPANYKKAKRQLMIDAGKQAGFEQVELLDEPIAAARYNAWHQSENKTADEVILIYDLGGGTFDASLVKKNGRDFQPLALSVGHERVGGIDFDRLLYRNLLAQCSETLRNQMEANDDSLSDEDKQLLKISNNLWLMDECREVKHQLSQDTDAVFRLPQAPLESYPVTRNDFNAMIAADIDQTISLCSQLLKDAKLEWEQVDRILLVGGSSRIPYVKEAIEAAFKRPVKRVETPELAVCLGASLNASVQEKKDGASTKLKDAIRLDQESITEKKKCPVLVSREKRLIGLAVKIILLVNGIEVYKLKNGETKSFDISPGKHVFQARHPVFGSIIKKTQEIDIPEGSIIEVKTFYGFYGIKLNIKIHAGNL